MRRITSVKVTPLEPPFDQDVMHFTFAGEFKELAVSLADGEAIKDLLGGAPVNRMVVLEAEGDDIRVSLVQ